MIFSLTSGELSRIILEKGRFYAIPFTRQSEIVVEAV